jgi:hypothetical protein
MILDVWNIKKGPIFFWIFQECWLICVISSPQPENHRILCNFTCTHIKCFKLKLKFKEESWAGIFLNYISKMFSKFSRSVVQRSVAPISVSSRGITATFDGYGQHCFKGAVAGPYLEKAGLPANTLDCVAWTSNGNADKVISLQYSFKYFNFRMLSILYMYIHIYMHIYIYIFLRIYVYTYIHMCIYTYVYLFINLNICV